MLTCLFAALLPLSGPATPPPTLPQAAKALGVDASHILGLATARLNRDQPPQTVVITCKSRAGGHPLGGEVVVLERRGGALVPVHRHPGLNPWKLAIADVDGDGQREIALGVWKKSPKDPVMAKRTFFYTWDGRRMLPKWLGSRLSRRFDDFAVGDINGDGWDELVSLEVAPHGRHRIGVYRWYSFGFAWLGGSAELPGLLRLDAVNGKVFAFSGHGGATVALSRGRVVLER